MWTDYRWGLPEICLYDVSTAEERRLTSDTVTQRHPAIHGTRVVWTDYRFGKGDILLHDLRTGATTNLTNDFWIDQQKPALNGRYVVWEEYGPGGANPNIVAYDTVLRTRTVLDPSDSPQQDPKVYSGRVVWTDFRTAGGDIRLYDPATGGARSMPAPAGTPQLDASISENHVVWTDYRNPATAPDIYLFDLVDPRAEPVAIAQTTMREEQASVSGRRVVWRDNQNGNYDVFAYDIPSRVKQAITSDASDQLKPVTSGGRVAWVDARTGTGGVWLADVVPAAVPSQPRTASGKTAFVAPLTGPLRVGFTGTLQPRHPAGTRAVTVEAYRYEGTEWIQKRTVRVAVGDSGPTTSKWQTTLALFPPGLWSVRAVHPDDGIHAYGESMYTNVTVAAPRVPLTVPKPSTTRTTRSKGLRVSGTVKPAHASGRIRIPCYENVAGRWVLVRTVSAACSPKTGPQSSYYATVRLPRGTWRFRARHLADMEHAETTTGYSVSVSVR